MSVEKSPRFLILRKDNIGDLVCTTPMIRMLRERYPNAWIGALVTRYNVEVLANNPDLDEVFAYQKSKHREAGEPRLKPYVERFKHILKLHFMRLDAVILPASGAQPSAQRMAKWLKPKRILTQQNNGVDEAANLLHEVERCVHLLKAFNITGNIPPCIVYPDEVAEVTAAKSLLCDPEQKILGIHISSRKPSQRWPEQNFITLIQRLHALDPQLHFALFWAPGTADNPKHPGDDEVAKRILHACKDCGVSAYRTESLRELIAGLNIVDFVFCSDGGHMHLASALGKPIVCLFGDSDATRWRPWGVPYQLLQAPSKQASDISVEQALIAIGKMMQESSLAQ